jgi:hypothetical protein
MKLLGYLSIQRVFADFLAKSDQVGARPRWAALTAACPQSATEDMLALVDDRITPLKTGGTVTRMCCAPCTHLP